jgi:hypothetical protein
LELEQGWTGLDVGELKRSLYKMEKIVKKNCVNI